ncbi:transcription initiation factor IIE, beta subunit [Lophium mytilinum]|uniref:Transcription initiation factor IIE subunit beta n=1 Tax=Lophium mytilinum TaxID=390894 RepID=A0A6A6Q8Z8_9PEZI|nr:transcription initiation factor IIE, beta subunit [Lophium mytilinum]
MSSFKSSSAVPGNLSVPSPTPSNASSGGTKRKRPADAIKPATSTVYSQPGETGTGLHIFTQVGYTTSFLRESGRPLTFKEITDYLNIAPDDVEVRNRLRTILRNPDTQKVQYNSKKDTYSYKPKSSVKTPEQLKGFLQNQQSACGITVKDLKDGWADAAEAINAMEAKKELLVTHNKKDGSARCVWINDPTLMHSLDADFLSEWHKIHLPANPDELRTKLLAANLKPASEARAAVKEKPKEKKKKAPRKGGKQTNTHMASILKDYSHKRK